MVDVAGSAMDGRAASALATAARCRISLSREHEHRARLREDAALVLRVARRDAPCDPGDLIEAFAKLVISGGLLCLSLKQVLDLLARERRSLDHELDSVKTRLLYLTGQARTLPASASPDIRAYLASRIAELEADSAAALSATSVIDHDIRWWRTRFTQQYAATRAAERLRELFRSCEAGLSIYDHADEIRAIAQALLSSELGMSHAHSNTG
jgi:hypothetical protein